MITLSFYYFSVFMYVLCSVDKVVVSDNWTQFDVFITTVINDAGTTQNDKHIVTEDDHIIWTMLIDLLTLLLRTMKLIL